jgi:hypothetical protein
MSLTLRTRSAQLDSVRGVAQVPARGGQLHAGASGDARPGVRNGGAEGRRGGIGSHGKPKEKR